MSRISLKAGLWFLVVAGAIRSTAAAGEPPGGQAAPRGETSFSPVDREEDFGALMRRMAGAKAEVMKRQKDHLAERYGLSNRPAQGVNMSRGKPVQGGVRVKLPRGASWDQLSTMKPDEIRNAGQFPLGFMPLAHANHPEGGMTFPQAHIDEVKKQEGRDLTRFDLDFDIPEHFLAEFPAAIFLTT